MTVTFDADFYASVGGRLYTPRTPDGAIHAGGGELPEWDFGWVPFQDRTPEENETHGRLVAEMPRFAIRGRDDGADEKSCLFDLWKHPEVRTALGFDYPGIHQYTGSCVGAGGGNTLFSLIAMEVIRLRDPEDVAVPFWLLTYGRSRYHAGMRGRGEGSFGSAFAKAAREDGTVMATEAGLPKFENADGLSWYANAEYVWSAGDQIEPSWLERSRKHLVRTTAECKSADDVRDALRNCYPCSCASNYGSTNQRVADGVLIGSRNTSWSHQMSTHAWWDHPSHGEIFWIQNQWGLRAHGTCPSGAPPGGFWVKKADMDWICRNGEVFAFSQFNGFPSQKISWFI